ncbi:N-acetylglutamate synthase [Methanococcoides vulcani]|uniref:N-acetylglutamate synthase n=1 Tax=Methanococcoides vulcani TaxID=1353158 RepID=A0A1I0BHA9_9EURY|nr:MULTISPECIES: N-acetyltransferase [Methanococcoides]SET06307.1 N-acetylglutamate synthase [Methanococcoides vulcani]
MIRKAELKDVDAIKKIINYYASQDQMLPRSVSELYEAIRNFYVYEVEGEFVGCCGLQVLWVDLAEVLSFAILPEYREKGIGTQLLDACLNDARELGVTKVFTLTYAPVFFEKNGFKRVDKSSLPHKIWSGCIKCPKFPDCDEIALSMHIS